MLDRYEILFGFLGGWVCSGGFLLIMERIRGSNLPLGSIITESQNEFEDPRLPGTLSSRCTILIGFSANSLFTIFVLLLCIIDLWSNISPLIIIPLPHWVNWLGMVLIWLSYGWGIAVLFYNVNYTPLFKPMKTRYILVTGGPYKWVRHPMYIQKAIFPILFFLATGIWLSLIGLVSWLGLPTQASSEEQFMWEKFGEDYTKYAMKTGRFFPKIRLNKIFS